ncbi:MAG TPA: hypothetical protein VND45_11305 [Thermoanaerobaculia bacterium]|jgi:hypothetical protein|nr:hypothetical protein [Thermoanaerobaculia bacterium]
MKRALAVLLLLAACSGEQPADTTAATTTQPAKPAAPPPPTAQQVHDLIAASPEFSEYEFTNAGYTTPTSGAAMNQPQRAAAKELAAAGWLIVDESGDIALSEKSRSDKRFLLRPNGLIDIVPLAKKEMGNVTAVRQDADGSVTADFAWKWIANEIGTAFQTGVEHDRFATPQDGRATLMWNGSAWTILKLE